MNDLSDLPLAESIPEDLEPDIPSRRDRIVVLGRRASGKTIYLSVLYEKYWKSLDGLTMKAVSGQVHSDCVRVVEGLRSGRWPAATLETQHCDLEIEYKGRRHLMVALDYAGELFRRAFVDDITDSPETMELVKHIDSAAAVMLLIDPATVVGPDVEAVIDDDFGMTQAVARIRNWPGGRNVPFVLVLTKGDENRELIRNEGGVEAFVKKRVPALARTLQKAAIFQVSSVQPEVLSDGTKAPRRDSAPWQIEKPLIYCLDQIDLSLELQEQEERVRRRRIAVDEKRKRQQRAARRTSLFIVGIVVSMIVIAGCVAALLWVYRK